MRMAHVKPGFTFQDGDWKESQHPRVPSGPTAGQFTSGGGGGSSSGVVHLTHPETKKKIEGLYQAGWSAKEIATELGIKNPSPEVMTEISKMVPAKKISKLSDPHVQEHIQSLHSAGWTALEIAGMIGVEPNDESVREILNIMHGEEEVAPTPSLKKAMLGVPGIKQDLSHPETHKKISEMYKMGKSTGSIAKELGHEASPETRKKIRAILRKAGLYKENGGKKPVEAPEAASMPADLHHLVSEYQKLQKEFGDKFVPAEKAKPLFDAYLKDKGVDDLSKKGYESSISQWTGSVTTKGALKLRYLAAQHYGRDWSNDYIPNHAKMGSDPAVLGAEEIKKAAFAMKEYAASYVAKAGIKKVYRGMSGDVANKIREAVVAGKDPEITANSLSSWSTSYATAKKFAHNGVVITRDVTPDDVWAVYKATPWTFSAHYHESEIIMGHPKHVEKIPRESVELLMTTAEHLEALKKSVAANA